MHIAIIPDGNRRWAKDNNKSLLEGYEKGLAVAKEIVQISAEKNINYLTLFVLSTENISRSNSWIESFTGIIRKYLKPMCLDAIQNGCKIQFLGQKNILGKDIEKMILDIEEQSPSLLKMHLNFCFGYSGRSDILKAVEKMIEVKADVKDLPLFLSTKDMPDPDLIIRTSGEIRLSNFLIFESAYSELFFTKEHWPDFTAQKFEDILAEFNARQRRFGK